MFGLGGGFQTNSKSNTASGWTSASNTSSTNQLETNPEDIPREELLHLCMKMNKRMQAMETKGREISKKKTLLFIERQKLLDLVKGAGVVLPWKKTTSVMGKEEGELDLGSLEENWLRWLRESHGRVLELEQLILERDRQYKTTISELEAKYRKEMIEHGTNHQNSGNNQVADLLGMEEMTTNEKQKQYHSEIDTILSEKQALQVELFEKESNMIKLQNEINHLQIIQKNMSEQMSQFETFISEKNQKLDELMKENEILKTSSEEQVVYLQMQLQSMKVKEDHKEKEMQSLKKNIENLTNQLSNLHRGLEEKDINVQSNKDILYSLQSRLEELEIELSHHKEKNHEFERNVHMNAMLKAESDGLINSLRKDLKTALDNREEAYRKLKDFEEFKLKYDSQVMRIAALNEQINVLQAGIDDKSALITRLRAEAQANDRNHAMRTAMLATCESQLESLQAELKLKEETTKEAVERVTELQMKFGLSEARLEDRIKEHNQAMEKIQREMEEEKEVHTSLVNSLKKTHEETLETLRKEHTKKSAMARTLVSEKEEEVRILSAKVAELQEEISSGAPADRKIIELAQLQARRDVTQRVHRDTQQFALQQLQDVLAEKDLELAKTQQKITDLSAEVVELRRTHQREGINMDYLKNVVIQYMTFPLQSSEKTSLVPVIAMLLQFNEKEMMEVSKSSQVSGLPLWTGLQPSRPVKEVKRFAPIESKSSHGANFHSLKKHPTSTNGQNHLVTEDSSNENLADLSISFSKSISETARSNHNLQHYKPEMDHDTHELNNSIDFDMLQSINEEFIDVAKRNSNHSESFDNFLGGDNQNLKAHRLMNMIDNDGKGGHGEGMEDGHMNESDDDHHQRAMLLTKNPYSISHSV